MEKKFAELPATKQKELVTDKIGRLTLLFNSEVDPDKRRQLKLRLVKGEDILQRINRRLAQTKVKSTDNICPVCGGLGEAPTKSMFDHRGQRTSGLIGFCSFCRGKGVLNSK